MPPFPRSDQASDPVPVIPEHRVVRCIGEGSYGRVWLAQSTLGTWRAIKVVQATTGHEGRTYERELDAVQRFEPLSREHDGFADILQTGRGGDGRWFYYVMELADDAVTGRPWHGDAGGAGYVPMTLSRVLRQRRRLPAWECVVLGLRLASALRRLHRAGLIHRDIKPSNIIFVNGEAKLADIGLVVQQSKARSYVGTHGYIPPDGPNTVQADIYAVGMVLYEAAMGLPHEQFPRPHPGIRSDPEAPALRELNAILLRACAPNPVQRYADGLGLESDLALLAEGGSVRRRRRWTRARALSPWLALAASLAVLAAWWMVRPADAPTEAGALEAAHMQVGRGVRLLEDHDPAGALVWYAEALPRMAQSSQEAHAHRVRVAQAISRIARLELLIHAGPSLRHLALSPDGSRVATADAQGAVDVWSLASGARTARAGSLGNHPLKLEFSADGQCLLAAPSVKEPAIRGPSVSFGRAFVIDPASGAAAEAGAGLAWGVFSPDGRWLASVRPGHEVWIHPADGSCPGRLMARFPQPVSALQFSPDNRLLASCSIDQTARVWRVSDGALACPVLPLSQGGISLGFSPDSRVLATVALGPGQASSQLQVWELASGRTVGAAEPVAGAVPFLEFNPVRPTRLLLGSLSGGLFIRDAQDGTARAAFSLPRSSMRCWAISPDGRRAAAGGADGSVRAWDTDAGQSLATIPVHARAVQWIRFTPDGGRLITASDDGLVRVWSLSTPSLGLAAVEVPGLSPPSGPALGRGGAAMDVSGRFLLSSRARGENRTPVAINLETGREESLPSDGAAIPCKHWVAGHGTPTWASAVLGGAGASGAHDIGLWRRSNRGWSFSRLPHPAPPWQARFTPDDRTLVTYAIDGCIRRWEVASGRLERQVLVPFIPGGHVALSDDGFKLALAGHDDRTLRVIEWQDPGKAAVEIPLPGACKSAHWHPSSPIFAAEIPGRGTLHWDSRSGRPIPALALPPGLHMSDWDPGFGRMLALDEFGMAHVVVLEPPAHVPLLEDSSPCQASALSFSPDGQFTVVVGKDPYVQVRAASSGQPVTPKLSTVGRPVWASLSRDGLLVAVADSQSVHRWRLAPAQGTALDLLDLAHLLAGRRVHATGQMEFMDPAELGRLAERLPGLLAALAVSGTGP